MTNTSRPAVFLVLGVFVLLPASGASAQERPNLRIPTIALSAAAAADWATTYHGLKYYHLHETNPLLQPWQDSHGRLVTMGALMDVGIITTWNLTVGARHPRVAAAGLWATAVFRSYLAVQNLRNERRALHR